MSLTLQDYADAKKLDVAALRALGLTDQSDRRGRYVRMPYFDEAGEEIATRQRFALDGLERFKWKLGSKPALYGQQRLAAARARGFIVVVEGESDCHTLWQNGVPAIGLPGAGNWREDRDAHLFDGIETIYVVHEGDKGTDTLIEWLAKSAIRHRARVAYFAPPCKDPSALHLADPRAFKAAMKAKLAAAVPWTAIAHAHASKDEREAYALCRTLAHTADIIQAFRTNLKAAGLVGEDRNASILYLALTSRLLKKLVSVAYKGPSSGGKSYAVDRVLAHFPHDAVVSITSMSEKALYFIEDDLAHKHLVIAEADGAAGDFQDYLVRSLLSEGRLEHHMADKTADGIVGRHIVKEGPTGLVITTTKVKLHPENETRVLSLTANDTPEQTRAVLAAVARRGDAAADVGGEWPALQAWLARGERRVAVPYAGLLARLVSDGAVRMRRDFGAVLSLVEAHALLHRATRERDGEGRIVATLADYAAVRALVFDIIAEGIAATVPASVREAVDAVRDLAGDGVASLHALARRLNIDKSSAARRCHAAKLAGYLINEEMQRGREARYKLGEPMPADTPVLPPVEDLEEEGQGRGVVYPLPIHRVTAPPQTDRRTGAANSEEVHDPPPPTEAQAARWSIRI